MRLAEAKAFILNQCNPFYDEAQLTAISWRIFEHLCNKSKLEIVLDKSIEFDTFLLEDIVTKLKQNKPIQYILGYEWFGGLQLKVNENVLIPRPETEELTRLLIKKVNDTKQRGIKIIDIGTGSGCIPVLLKKECPAAEISAMDISAKALEVAQENATIHHTPVYFVQANILDEALNLHEQFDFIISNPPYILQEEKKEMNTRVFEHEPQIALFVTQNDPLEFYKAIISFSKNHLKQHGSIYMEINQLYGADIQSLFERHNYHCEILQDMYGNDRFAIAEK